MAFSLIRNQNLPFSVNLLLSKQCSRLLVSLFISSQSLSLSDQITEEIFPFNFPLSNPNPKNPALSVQVFKTDNVSPNFITLSPLNISLHSVSLKMSETKETPKKEEPTVVGNNWDQRLRFPIRESLKKSVKRRRLGNEAPSTPAAKRKKRLDDLVKDWVNQKVTLGVPESHCRLPFVYKDPQPEECLLCRDYIYSDEVSCSVSSCMRLYHRKCAKEKLGYSGFRKFKCPQHACFLCKAKRSWSCIRCTAASHPHCAPWPNQVTYLPGQPYHAVCWRHPADWRLEKKDSVPTSDMEEIFRLLPVPYVQQEFTIDLNWKDINKSTTEPPPYIRITRNEYIGRLTKKQRYSGVSDAGCTDCDPTECCEDCVCRVQSLSCSKACHCKSTCNNRPFRKKKKIKVVKTQNCGWGIQAAEPIMQGEFIIEYVGEVIGTMKCIRRLWDMKNRGDENFYMCEIRPDLTVDATFKGNKSRFLNHSCEPNCKMEKWQVGRETRLGVFALSFIEAGEPLTYDYRFELYGPKVKCCCDSSNCRGFLGSKKKVWSKEKGKTNKSNHPKCKRVLAATSLEISNE